MKKWFVTQLTEPTAWLCAVIMVSLVVFPDWFVFLLCIAGILMDEAAMKAWCAKVAPGIAKKVEEWTT